MNERRIVVPSGHANTIHEQGMWGVDCPACDELKDAREKELYRRLTEEKWYGPPPLPLRRQPPPLPPMTVTKGVDVPISGVLVLGAVAVAMVVAVVCR